MRIPFAIAAIALLASCAAAQPLRPLPDPEPSNLGIQSVSFICVSTTCTATIEYDDASKALPLTAIQWTSDVCAKTSSSVCSPDSYAAGTFTSMSASVDDPTIYTYTTYLPTPPTGTVKSSYNNVAIWAKEVRLGTYYISRPAILLGNTTLTAWSGSSPATAATALTFCLAGLLVAAGGV